MSGIGQDMGQSYNGPARFFHWLIAVLILGLLSAGFFMTAIDVSPLKLQIYGLHKSLGITVLALALARLFWRFATPTPPSLPTHAGWEKFLSHITHFLLYALIMLMPLSGWVMSSAGDFPNSFFGLFEMPDIVAKNKDIFEISREAHEVMAFVIIALVALHMAGAFKHHFIDRDITLKRMTFNKLGFGGGVLLVLVFGGLWALASYFLVAKEIMPKYKTDAALAERVVSKDLESEEAVEKAVAVKLWNIRDETSRIGFEATQYGQSFSGAFKEFGGYIAFDPENLEDSNVRVEIEIASIDTGSADRDAQAKSQEWFAAGKYPRAVFEADDFEFIEANRYIANGHLTIRGTRLPLALPFSLDLREEEREQIARMESQVTLQRLDYGIGQGQWQSTDTIGDEVKLSIVVEAEARESESD